MKILIPSLDTIHTRNIGACLKSCDFMQTALWDVSRKSLIDAFDEINPDVVFLHENQLDQSFDIVAKQDNFKYFLICSSMPSRISKAPSAVITGSQFLHNFKPEHNAVALGPAANVSQIHAGSSRPEMATDALVITGGFPMTEDIMQMISFLCSSYKTRIVGAHPVPFPNYLGAVAIFERADLIASAKVLVDFGSYDAMDAKYLKTASVFMPENVVDLESSLDRLLSKRKVRKQLQKKEYEEIIKNGTYYHRCASLFDLINEKEISKKILKAFEELIK